MLALLCCAQVDTAREESKSKDAVIQDLQEQVGIINVAGASPAGRQ